MKKFRLIPVKSGEMYEKSAVKVEGFINAESKAKEMLKEIYRDYPCDDTYIILADDDSWYISDYFVMEVDYYGDMHWMRMIKGYYGGNLDTRFPNDNEMEILQDWREDYDADIHDLSYNELVSLRGEISVGSMYYSDYENTFHVNERDLCDVCDEYDYWCEYEGVEDNGDNFAYYIMNVA